MLEHEAQTVLLVKAFEEADRDGLLLSADDRRTAGDAARSDAGDGSDAAVTRAAHLLGVLEAKVPGTAALLRGTRLGAGAVPWVLVGAFVVGLASNALGPQHRIAVWQWPFVFLFAWNLLWYAIFLVGPWLHRAPGAGAGPGAASRAGGAVVALAGRGARVAGRLVEWSLARFTSRARKRDAKTAAVTAMAVARYAAEWRRATGPLLASRTRLVLHAGSLALALGLVVGMYARGLTFRYEAAWESTVLDGATLQRMVNGLLGPAATLFGRRVPDVGPALAPQPAAPWLHLYALATLLYVALPRTLFLVREAARASRLAARVPADLSPAYTRRAGLAPAGEGRRVVWCGYGYRAAPRAADALTALLHGAFGTKCEVARAPDLEYGTEAADAAGTARGASVVILVSAAQTPESEVHGAFLAGLVRAGTRPIVVADASPLAARGADEARLDERRRLWSRIGREAGVEVVHVGLDASEGDAAIDRLAAAAGTGGPSGDAPR